MFGGMSSGPDSELLSDLVLDKVDYDWIKATKKISLLKKAIKLIEQDGDYFPDLKRAVENRIAELDPSQAKKTFDNRLTEDEKSKIDHDLATFIEQQQSNEAKLASDIFSEQKSTTDVVDKKKLAENEKNKGNEALKSKDYNEALQYYSKSIEYDPKLAASYCNRALVHLRLKDNDNCIKDCNRALQLDAGYLKAFHRRGKAYMEQKNYAQAYTDFKFIMEKEPDNADVNGDLQECIQKLGKEGVSKEKGFKRVQIVEEDEDEVNKAEEDAKSKEDHLKLLKSVDDRKEDLIQRMKQGAFEPSIAGLQACIADLKKAGPLDGDIQSHERRIADLNLNIARCYKQVDNNKAIIQHTTLVVDQKEHLDKEILAQAYLIRGMAYEGQEKYRSSKNDFLSVKEYDPSNLQASKGLSRVSAHAHLEKEAEPKPEVVVAQQSQQQTQQPPQQHTQQQPQPEKKQPYKGAPTVTLQAIDQIKAEGNTFFKANKLEEALLKFNEGSAILEEQYFYQIGRREEDTIKLYQNILTNKALCELNLKKYEEVVKTTDKAIDIEANNSKALYRRGQAYKALAEALGESQEVDLLKKQNDVFEKAKVDLEKLTKLEPTNKQVKDFLSDVVKSIVRIRLQLREKENADGSASKPKKQSEQSDVEMPKAQTEQNLKKKVGGNLTTEQLEKVAQNARQTITDELINSTEVPATASIFEKNLNSFKKNADKLFDYVKKFDSKFFINLYSKKDIPPENLMMIIRAIKDNSDSTTKDISSDIVTGLTKTCKFNLSVMCLTKGEKKDVVEVLDKLQVEQEVRTAYKV